MDRALRRLSWPVVALVFALGAGVAADRPVTRAPVVIGGYRVLAADFHMHSSTWSDGALTPWGLVLEAERQRLDVLAVTGHNEVGDSRLARWFSERIGGPLVLTGQEILAPDHHVIAIGISRVVDWRLDVAAEIAAVHAQGGVAIAAHPLAEFWSGFDEAARDALDGAEICHPMIFARDNAESQLEAFAAGRRFAAIGSSDFHGVGRLGMCRTYVFATADTADAVLDAVRAGRTVVYGRNGQPYGDHDLVRLADASPELREAATTDQPPTAADWMSRLAGVCGMAGLAARSRRTRTPRR
jgi:hypothetical protein